MGRITTKNFFRVVSGACNARLRLVGATHRPTSGPLFNDKDKGVTKRKLPHYFRYYRAEDRVVAVNRMKGKESSITTNSGAISRNVLIHLQKVEKEMEVVDIWCKIKYRTKLHCCKNDHTNMTVYLHRSWRKVEMIGVGVSLQWGDTMKSWHIFFFCLLLRTS